MEMNYSQFKEIRKSILSKHKDDDNFYIKGTNNVLISCPHAVPQTRLGKLKVAEMGTLSFGYFLAQQTSSHYIVKTKNNYDDANFDAVSIYREKMKKIIKENNIKYIFDIHGLSRSHEIDLNFGTHHDENIKNDRKLFEKLIEGVKNDFFYSIDNPYSGGYGTISGYFSKEFGAWTLQVEINCGITNDPKNIKKQNLLLTKFVELINQNINQK